MTEIHNPEQAGVALKERGAANVIVKLGEKGCSIVGDSFTGQIPAPKVAVVDTTGAGDAFAAGFIAAYAAGRIFKMQSRQETNLAHVLRANLGPFKPGSKNSYF